MIGAPVQRDGAPREIGEQREERAAALFRARHGTLGALLRWRREEAEVLHAAAQRASGDAEILRGGDLVCRPRAAAPRRCGVARDRAPRRAARPARGSTPPPTPRAASAASARDRSRRPSRRATPRTITFRSSRTLPGQSYERSEASAPSVRDPRRALPSARTPRARSAARDPRARTAARAAAERRS